MDAVTLQYECEASWLIQHYHFEITESVLPQVVRIIDIPIDCKEDYYMLFDEHVQAPRSLLT